jgi:GT2 family glycosyltransferase
LNRQVDIDYEIILVDNDSKRANSILFFLQTLRLASATFVRSPKNLFFSGGMNLGAKCAARESTHLLLLNSDVEFLEPRALKKTAEAHKRGVTGYEFLTNPDRCDGFCFLVDRDLYEQLGGLDERFKWWWAITKFQGDIISRGFDVQAIEQYQHLLLHHGGKSGDAWKAVNVSTRPIEADGWFPNCYSIKRIVL